MNGPRDYHTKWRKSEKGKASIIWNHIYVKSKKMTQMKLFANETHRLRKTKTKTKTYGYQRGKVSGRDKLGNWD